MDFVILEKLKVYEGVEKVGYNSNFEKNNRVGKGEGKLVCGLRERNVLVALLV